MTARRTVRWACHWTATTVTAASLAAAVPFAGPYASAAGLLAAAGVAMTGIATAPTIQKDSRP